MDGEFKMVKNELPFIVYNNTTAKEHVAEAEHPIRVVKEKHRGVLCTVPYKYVPQRMKMETLYFVVLWTNAFPVKNGISAVCSPRKIIARRRMDYKSIAEWRLEDGTYCEVHDEPSPSNSTESITHEGIALGPT